MPPVNPAVRQGNPYMWKDSQISCLGVWGHLLRNLWLDYVCSVWLEDSWQSPVA